MMDIVNQIKRQAPLMMLAFFNVN